VSWCLRGKERQVKPEQRLKAHLKLSNPKSYKKIAKFLLKNNFSIDEVVISGNISQQVEYEW